MCFYTILRIGDIRRAGQKSLTFHRSKTIFHSQNCLNAVERVKGLTINQRNGNVKYHNKIIICINYRFINDL